MTFSVPSVRFPSQIAMLATEFVMRREMIYPKSAERFHHSAAQTAGTAGWSLTFDTTQTFSYYRFITTPADGDAFENYFCLRGGSYTLTVLGVTDAANGKLDWYIDNTLAVSGQDWYGGTVRNIYKTASVTVPGGGFHTLKGVINGKNSSSTNYWSLLTYYKFT